MPKRRHQIGGYCFTRLWSNFSRFAPIPIIGTPSIFFFSLGKHSLNLTQGILPLDFSGGRAFVIWQGGSLSMKDKHAFQAQKPLRKSKVDLLFLRFWAPLNAQRKRIASMFYPMGVCA